MTALAVAGLGVAGYLIATHWPFSRAEVIRSLEEASAATVNVGGFREVFFPKPGCVAENVVIEHPGDPSGPPMITISRLTVSSDYSRLIRFSKDLTYIRTEGMHIRIRPGKQAGAGGKTTGSSVTVDTLVAEGTLLEFLSEESGKPPFVISIHHARLSPVSARRPLNFEADLAIPTPPGEIHSSGKFGPWNVRDAFATPIKGSFQFHHADLGFSGGIAGTLESEGQYEGAIRELHVTDRSSVPDFRVSSANHPVGLIAQVDATVDGETGDTVLHAIAAQFRNTHVTGRGDVAAQAPGGDKKVSLALGVPRGRIDDFLYLLTQEERPSMTGDLTLNTRVSMPPGRESFLKKLRMNGAFHITNGRFSASATEQSLDRIRDKSRHTPTDYTEATAVELLGNAVVKQGVAQLENLTFESAGVLARLSGTFDVLSTRFDLRGRAHLDTTVASATTGVKSVLLKILNPFFKSRGQKGSDVPVKITGTYGNTSVGLDLKQKK